MSEKHEFNYVMLRSYLLGQGFVINDDKVEDPYEDGLLKECSYTTGEDIWIGEYENPEHRILALAHEAGHTLSGWSRLHGKFNFKHEDMRIEHPGLIVESMAWEAGFVLLDELDIQVSDESLEYVSECLCSYMGYKG